MECILWYEYYLWAKFLRSLIIINIFPWCRYLPLFISNARHSYLFGTLSNTHFLAVPPPKGDQSIPRGAVHRPGLLPGQGDPSAAGPHVQGQHRLRVKPKGNEEPSYCKHPISEREFTIHGSSSSRMAGWTDL